jgi:hypothetical protein
MLVHHIVVDVEGVVKQAFGEAVAADGLRGARLAEAGQREFAGFDPDEALPRHAKECGPVGQEFRHFLGAYNAFPGVLLSVPDSLEEIANQLSFDGGENRSLRQAGIGLNRFEADNGVKDRQRRHAPPLTSKLFDRAHNSLIHGVRCGRVFGHAPPLTGFLSWRE